MNIQNAENTGEIINPGQPNDPAQPVSPTNELPQIPHNKISKRIIIIGGGVLLAILIIVILAISFRTQQIHQGQSIIPPTSVENLKLNPLIAKVGGEPIYKNDILSLAEKQYTPKSIDKNILKRFLDTIIEQKILDMEAHKENIVISASDSAMYLMSNHQPNNPQTVVLAKYTLIKQKIVLHQVNSIQAYTIDYWVPPLSYPQQPLFAKQRQDGQAALQDAKQQILAGKTPFVAGLNIYSKYPSLQSLLAVNGYFLDKKLNEQNAVTPKTYTPGHTDFDDSIFLLKSGDIQIINGKDGAGALLIQVVSVNNGSFKSYDTWLSQQKKSLVQYINTL